MAMITVLGVPYTAAHSDRFLQFDGYAVQGSVQRPVLVFVHGGAWRSEDKADHAALAQSLALATNCPVLVPNYRLTSKTISDLRHPAHAQDILHFLEFLLDWRPLEFPELAAAMDPKNLYLIGHSCSAHMLASIILDSDFVTPTLAPSAKLLKAVKAVIFSEGIYDLDSLVERFPNYRAWFIDEAFGAQSSYSQFNVNQYQLRKGLGDDGRPASWLIIHSKGDDLIDVGQSKAMLAHLRQLYAEQADTFVHHDLDRLTAGHDDILRGDQGYVDIVKLFLQRVDTMLREPQSVV
ncbi:hypothetical protein CC1G_11927 [Coprinopsis cinerea okayama7|uniref:BD-FAE-like domain-containing protein n=1 Tax=Coprinopsis cinerea (strain Okayama-7 / 130 / ATCC MYA-4618 / FGSC 9003) TaxID=240176 RepID=A8NFR4_COPC7|nr:hypothetical protein CC1G_11927 [Coprinopsis cinerea okayama7\|eukprot:XP_001833350.1 hypothetical protein CC1G_11927 [Coprinopsis cinerea okayama7\